MVSSWWENNFWVFPKASCCQLGAAEPPGGEGGIPWGIPPGQPAAAEEEHRLRRRRALLGSSTAPAVCARLWLPNAGEERGLFLGSTRKKQAIRVSVVHAQMAEPMHVDANPVSAETSDRVRELGRGISLLHLQRTREAEAVLTALASARDVSTSQDGDNCALHVDVQVLALAGYTLRQLRMHDRADEMLGRGRCCVIPCSSKIMQTHVAHVNACMHACMHACMRVCVCVRARTHTHTRTNSECTHTQRSAGQAPRHIRTPRLAASPQSVSSCCSLHRGLFTRRGAMGSVRT